MDPPMEPSDSLATLRTRVQDILTPYYDHDFNLDHWLTAYNSNIDEIEPKLRLHLEYRRIMDLDQEYLGSTWGPEFEQVNAVLNRIFKDLEFTGSYDREGNPVAIIEAGKVDLSAPELGQIKNSDFFKQRILITEEARRTLHGLELKKGQRLGFTVIYDLEGLQMGRALLDALNGPIRKITTLVQDHFPEITRRLLIINTPPIMDYLWTLVRGFLASRTQAKVVILGQQWRQEILKYIDLSSLPEKYGGNLSIMDGIDQDIFLDCDSKPDWSVQAETLPTLGQAPPSPPSLKVAFIKPRTSFTLKHCQMTPGGHLKWFFKANGDLSFSITGGQDEENQKLMIPIFSLSTNVIPEYGSLENLTKGLYSINFMNDSGLFLATKLEYSVSICASSGEEVVL